MSNLKRRVTRLGRNAGSALPIVVREHLETIPRTLRGALRMPRRPVAMFW